MVIDLHVKLVVSSLCVIDIIPQTGASRREIPVTREVRIRNQQPTSVYRVLRTIEEEEVAF